MSAERTQLTARQHSVLQALKLAVVEGATGQYQSLLDRAAQAGVTDEEIDLTVHEALRNLFANAERPVTVRDLANLVPAGYPAE
jgi:hypothetical protein